MPGLPFPIIAVALALGVTACATTGEKPARTPPGQVEGAMNRPLTDLGIVRTTIPEALQTAVAAPYAVANPTDCPILSAEIARLDEALGPDLDSERAKSEGVASEMLLGAFQSALDLPYRGILRRLTGAEKRDRARTTAVLAGMVRRAWLKGLARNANCPAPPAPPAAG
ncbi:MAG: hypothetical protein HY859_07375 [Caulobacterales bacterium]|nr:hypothetical protein [Caulobacterales bacterium]